MKLQPAELARVQLAFSEGALSTQLSKLRAVMRSKVSVIDANFIELEVKIFETIQATT